MTRPSAPNPAIRSLRWGGVVISSGARSGANSSMGWRSNVRTSGGAVVAARVLNGAANDGLMPSMHAVERADGDRRGRERRGDGVKTVVNLHGLARILHFDLRVGMCKRVCTVRFYDARSWYPCRAALPCYGANTLRGRSLLSRRAAMAITSLAVCIHQGDKRLLVRVRFLRYRAVIRAGNRHIR